MTVPIQDTIQRILVACDTRHTAVTLATAVQLAAQMQAEICGLFVEDENLLRLAGLPFAREIGGTSAVPRPLNSEIVERTLRAHADEAKRTLIQMAERDRVRWSFQVQRGQVPETTFAAAADADVTVIGAEHSSVVAHFCRDASARPTAKSTRSVGKGGRSKDELPPIIVMMDGSPGACRALQIGLHISRRTACELVIVLSPAGDHSGEELRDTTEATIRGEPPTGTAPRVEPITSPYFRGLRGHVQLVLVGQDRVLSGDESLGQVFTWLACPLALVR